MAPSPYLALAVPVAAACWLFACGGPSDKPVATEVRADASPATSVDAAVSPPVDGAPSDAGQAAYDAASDVDADPIVPSTMITIPLTGCAPFYTAGVTLGGTQTFQLAVDTQSTTLAVAGSDCPTCAEAGVAPVYQPGPSAVDTKTMASSLYAAGSIGWTGEVYTDTVQVGGVGPPVTTEIAVMQTQMGLFGSGGTGAACGLGEGIVGLAPADVAVPGTNGFFDQLVATGLPNVFSVELCDTNGFLWLGGYDPSRVLAPPKFTPMVSNQFYAVQLSGVMVSGQSLTVPSSAYGNGTTILDSGGPLFYLPSAVFSAVSAAITADPAFQQTVGGADWFSAGGCMSLSPTRAQLDAMLPQLTVTFGANPGVSIQAAATSSYLSIYPSGGQTYWCPGIAAWDPSWGNNIAADLGGPFLDSIVIFDRQNQRVGFAPHADCP
jgi:hypothetical protein